MRIEEVRDKMEKALEAVKKNFAGVRTSRASPALLENVVAEAYGQKMPLKQLATIHVQEGKTLIVTPFDKGNLQAIEKGISQADLGLTPQNDKNILRINLPDLTEARRLELEKVLKNMSEEGKIAVRNVRRDAIDSLKKNKDISEDENKGLQDKVQKLTDEYNHKIDQLLKTKEAEIREI